MYDLRADKLRVRHMQEATKARPDVGLAPVPALVGSWRWWRAINSGRFPSTTLEGTVANVYWGSMGDWPMFTLRTTAGETSAGHGKVTTLDTSKASRYGSST